jgi:phage baseplate assembly protein W
MRRRLRERSEHYLLQAAIRELGSGAPGTVRPHRARGGLLWRFVFVPVYRRVPWAVKARAMRALRMTASGFTPPSRRPGEPWRPPRD